MALVTEHEVNAAVRHWYKMSQKQFADGRYHHRNRCPFEDLRAEITETIIDDGGMVCREASEEEAERLLCGNACPGLFSKRVARYMAENNECPCDVLGYDAVVERLREIGVLQ